MIHGGLVLLSLRRTLGPGLVTLVALLALVLVLEGSGAAPVPAELAGGLADAAALEAAWWRQAVWIAYVALLLPLVTHRAARFASDWRRADADWIGARAVRRRAVVASAWAGVALGALVASAAVAAVAEGPSLGGGAPRALQRVADLPAPQAVMLEPDAAVAWRVEDLPRRAPGGRLALALGTAPGSGPTADVRWTATREGDASSSTTVDERVFGRRVLALDVPPGDGPLRLELRRHGPGCALVVAPDALSLLRPRASVRRTSLELFARTTALLLGAAALALGLGAWMRAPLATALVLALELQAGLSRAELPGWPGADLAAALADVGRGLVPRPWSPLELLGVAALALAGGLLALAAVAARGRAGGAA